jgi:peptidoglycan/LPS O-acetylase OafA/YrhL
MKLLAMGSLWFLGVWVAYDMTAYAFGLPRQITPLIALVVAVAVVRILTANTSRAATLSRLPRLGEATLRNS